MAHDKNNFVTRFFANLVCTILLCTSQTAQADFRKALTAYQNRDGKTMLAEVQDAVDKKNDDGFVLFVGALQLDEILATRRVYVGEKEMKEIFVSKNKINLPKTVLETLIEPAQITTLFNSLDLLSKQSSFEARYEYLLLRYGDLLPDFLRIMTEEVRNEKLKEGQYFFEDKKILISEMTILAKNGYGKAAYFLYQLDKLQSLNSKNNSLEIANNWLDIAKNNQYELVFDKQLNSFLPKKDKKQNNSPIISVYRYDDFQQSNFIQTNYFLDIYENGDVNFYRGTFIDAPTNKKNIIKKLKKSEVNDIVVAVKKLGFHKHSLQSSNVKASDAIWAGESFGDVSIRRTYYVTLKTNNKQRTLVFKIAEEENHIPTLLAKTLNLLENKVPTLFYRCGLPTMRAYYQYCVNQDLKNNSF